RGCGGYAAWVSAENTDGDEFVRAQAANIRRVLESLQNESFQTVDLVLVIGRVARFAIEVGRFILTCHLLPDSIPFRIIGGIRFLCLLLGGAEERQVELDHKKRAHAL